MRVGSTRRWRRGQMQRARERDQRLVADTRSLAIEDGLCMGIPLALSIARAQIRAPRRPAKETIRKKWEAFACRTAWIQSDYCNGNGTLALGAFSSAGKPPSQCLSQERQIAGFLPKAVAGTSAEGLSCSSTTAPPSKVLSASSFAAMAIQHTAPFLSSVHAISTV